MEVKANLDCIEGPIQYIVFDVFNDAVRQKVNAHKLQRKREITLLCKSHHLENPGDFGKNTTTVQQVFRAQNQYTVGFFYEM